MRNATSTPGDVVAARGGAATGGSGHLADLPSAAGDTVAGEYLKRSWAAFEGSLSRADGDATRRLVARLFGGIVVVLALMASTAWAVGVTQGRGPLPGDAVAAAVVRQVMPVTAADSVTPLGGTLLLLPLVALVAMVAARRARPDRALILVTTFLASKAATKVGWDFWARERPGGVGSDAYIPAAPSFPSGHALQATAIWTLLGVWWIRGTRSTAERTVAAATTLVVVGATGLTRIRLGAHYASDVGAAVVFGLLLAGVALWAERGFESDSHLQRGEPR